MIKAVLIDIDNTLLSFSGYVKQAMEEGFRKFGLKEYDESMFPVFKEINDGLWREIEKGTLDYEELLTIRWNRIFEALGIDFDGEVFEKFFKDHMFYSGVPEDHAIEMLDHLKGRYILCTASNGPFAQQINRLRVAGMYGYFDHFFISGAIGVNKPDKGFFEYCLDKINEDGDDDILPEECIIIGDSLTSDIAGGRDFGMKTLFYMREPVDGDKLTGCDCVVTSLDEVKDIL